MGTAAAASCLISVNRQGLLSHAAAHAVRRRQRANVSALPCLLHAVVGDGWPTAGPAEMHAGGAVVTTPATTARLSRSPQTSVGLVRRVRPRNPLAAARGSGQRVCGRPRYWLGGRAAAEE